MWSRLRYILFHHQTTTVRVDCWPRVCCVISSFITKPQLMPNSSIKGDVALYPLSSPNHNQLSTISLLIRVALYPLSSPNHNAQLYYTNASNVALYPLSSPNHNWKRTPPLKLNELRYILFHHQTTTPW